MATLIIDYASNIEALVQSVDSFRLPEAAFVGLESLQAQCGAEWDENSIIEQCIQIDSEAADAAENTDPDDEDDHDVFDRNRSVGIVRKLSDRRR